VDGKRSGLYRAMVEVVSKIRPKVFVAENVKGLLMKHNEKSLKQILSDFRVLGVTKALRNDGWKVIRIWECEIKKHKYIRKINLILSLL
jgi:site-specific DNA-cytosine methylase